MVTAETVAQPGWYAWGIGYGYDTSGHLASQSYPSGLSVGYAPNALGQATQAGSYATGVQYFPNGAIKQFAYGNGLVHTLTQNARQLPLTSTDSGGALSQEYTYDKNGNVDRVIDNLDPSRNRWTYYDGLDRLVEAGSASFGGDHWHRFSYDALDNMRSWKLSGVKDNANYVYDASNRLKEIRNTAGSLVHQFSYDVQGNLVNKNSVGHDFDFGNRLREVTGQEYYRYDGMGRRVLAWRPVGGNTLSMYSQSGQVAYQYSEPKSRASEQIYLGGSLVAIRERNVNNDAIEVKYQHTDALGSPVAVSNESGAVLAGERTNYDPYGGAIGKVVDGVGYTGHVMDPATGLTYMQQRYYDPSVGRFLSVDPVTASSINGGNFNRYWYANNNPYKFTDPDGRLSMRPHKTFCEVIGVCLSTNGAESRPKQEKAASGDNESKPSAEEISFVRSNADWIRGQKTENCGKICTGGAGIVLSSVLNDGSQIGCDAGPATCPAGTVESSDIHGHLPAGNYYLNAVDVRYLGRGKVGDSFSLSERKANNFSRTDKQVNKEVNVGGWLIPATGNIIKYFNQESGEVTEYEIHSQD